VVRQLRSKVPWVGLASARPGNRNQTKEYYVPHELPTSFPETLAKRAEDPANDAPTASLGACAEDPLNVISVVGRLTITPDVPKLPIETGTGKQFPPKPPILVICDGDLG
jgi:hypothetical protein